jgi:archaellum biogenesis ATPase FlaH
MNLDGDLTNLDKEIKALAREQRRQDTLANLKLIARRMRDKGASPASIKKALEGTYEILKHKEDSPLSQQELNKLAGVPSAPVPNTQTAGHLLAEFETEQIQWLWPGRIALGKITLLDGDPGMGKSLLAIDIAARVSTGQPMPDNTPGKHGTVILIAPEDGASDTLKPRLQAAGGDPSHVLLLNSLESLDPKRLRIYDRPFSLSEDLDILEKAIKDMQASLVILDPLMAILGSDIDSSRDQSIREVFTPLAHLAEQASCAILVIRHLSKINPSNPLYRGAGSIGIIASARTGLIVAPHPDNQDQRILATTKNNLSKHTTNLVFQITEKTPGIPSIHWLGETNLTLSTLFSTSTSTSALRQDILRTLKDSTVPLGPQEIAARTGYNYSSIRPTLRRMHAAQEITTLARGLYTTPDHPCLTKNAPANSPIPTNPLQHPQQQ